MSLPGGGAANQTRAPIWSILAHRERDISQTCSQLPTSRQIAEGKSIPEHANLAAKFYARECAHADSLSPSVDVGRPSSKLKRTSIAIPRTSISC